MRLVWGLTICAMLASCGAMSPLARVSGQGGAPATRMTGGPATAQEGPALNALRAENGLAPLSRSAALDAAARAHARDMDRKGYFSHRAPDGSDAMQRARRAGYRPCRIAENIAQGQRSLGEVMADWAGSPGHRRNMLQPGVTDYGLARSSGGSWVMVLGREGC